MYTEDQIAYENATHWVLDDGVNDYKVFRNGITHSTKCATIGRSLGIERAILEAVRRDSAVKKTFTTAISE